MPPEPDEGQAPPGDPVHARVVDRPPIAGHRAGRRHDAARPREEQGHRMVGDLIEAVVRDVRHHDPVAGRGLDRDVVVADPIPRDDPAPSRRGDVDHALAHRREADEHRVDVHCQVEQGLLGAVRRHDDLGVERPEHLVLGAQVGEDVIGDQDTRHYDRRSSGSADAS
jgi:hypothetical protein